MWMLQKLLWRQALLQVWVRGYWLPHQMNRRLQALQPRKPYLVWPAEQCP
jgi:hypothetical protein